jgi:hypothetical protein
MLAIEGRSAHDIKCLYKFVFLAVTVECEPCCEEPDEDSDGEPVEDSKDGDYLPDSDEEDAEEYIAARPAARSRLVQLIIFELC